MFKLPEYLSEGRPVRLIPYVGDGQRERAACSVLLATLSVVPPFAAKLLGEIGQKLGARSRVSAYLEPVFKKQPETMICRPDGLLILRKGKHRWRAILETKVGNAKILPGQIARYYALAKSNNIDAIITISNETNAFPKHIPYPLMKSMRGVDLFHWSWAHLVMRAEYLLLEQKDFDEEQDFILQEVKHFLLQDGTGADANGCMGPEWPELVRKVRSDIPLTLKDEDLRESVSCWHRQLANVTTSLSCELKVPVSLKLKHAERADYRLWQSEDEKAFVAKKKFAACLKFSKYPGPVELTVDAKSRNISCRIRLDAPTDRGWRACLTWLLHQLPESADAKAWVDVIWENTQRSHTTLPKLRNGGAVEPPVKGLAIRAFDIIMEKDLNARFSGVHTFVQDLEAILREFYQLILRHLQQWQPSSPAQTGVTSGSMSDVLEADVPPDAEALQCEDPESESEANILCRDIYRGRNYAVYRDGSIRIETANGMRHFRNFEELKAAEKGLAAAAPPPETNFYRVGAAS